MGEFLKYMFKKLFFNKELILISDSILENTDCFNRSKKNEQNKLWVGI